MASKWLIITIASVIVTGASLALLGAGKTREAASPAETRLEPVVTRSGTYRLSLHPADPARLVGTTQTWTVRVKDSSGAPKAGCQLRFDGEMPEHGHGLPTAPKMTREVEPGAYLIEGVRLSMPGYWRLSLDVAGCGPADSAISELRL